MKKARKRLKAAGYREWEFGFMPHQRVQNYWRVLTESKRAQ